MSSGASAIEKSIRRAAIIRNSPTPPATARISVRLGMDGTCPASTCKSGSEMVIMKPRRKQRNSTSPRCMLPAIFLPTFSPMGVMDSSAPRLKNIMPRISRIPPKRNSRRIPEGRGAMVKLKRSTIPIMGRTAFNASLSFSSRFV